MRRIFTNIAFIVDANGAYHIMDGYPKTFDSKNYSDNEKKAYLRATGDAHTMFGTMCTNDTRIVQTVVVLDDSGNIVLPLTTGGFEEPEPNEE